MTNETEQAMKVLFEATRQKGDDEKVYCPKCKQEANPILPRHPGFYNCPNPSCKMFVFKVVNQGEKIICLYLKLSIMLREKKSRDWATMLHLSRFLRRREK